MSNAAKDYSVRLDSEEEVNKFERRVELFAAHALQGILSNGGETKNLADSESVDDSILIEIVELAADYGGNLAITLAKRGY